MKLVNFKKAGANALGIVTERGVVDVSAFAGPDTPLTMARALAMGREHAVAALSGVVQRADVFLPPKRLVFAPRFFYNDPAGSFPLSFRSIRRRT